MPKSHPALRAGAVIAALAAGVAGASPASAAEVYNRPADSTIDLVGRGFGHGRGMSQYGAMNAARHGQSWQQIVSHYYPGAARTPLGNPTIRVGVAGKVGATARVAAEAGLVADDGRGQVVSLAATDFGVPVTSWFVARPTKGGTATTATLWFTTSKGKVAPLRSTGSGRWTIRDTDGTVTALNSAGKPAATYVGSLAGVRTGTTISPVVTTSMESYVRQVVPFESPGSWPVQALAAQSVAARSYAASALRRPRSTIYDICDTTACQVFGGISHETANSRAGVAATSGVVLTSGGVPALTEFSSSNGGQRVYGNRSYLPGTPDADEAGLAASANQWSTAVPVSRLESAYPAIGSFRRLTVVQRDGKGLWGGRILLLRLEGTRGSVQITGDRFRALVGTSVVRSTYFTPVSGR